MVVSSMAEALAPLLTILSIFGFKAQSKQDVGVRIRIEKLCVRITLYFILLSTLLYWLGSFYVYIATEQATVRFSSGMDLKIFGRRYFIYITNLLVNSICVAYIVLNTKSRVLILMFESIAVRPRQYKMIRCLANVVAIYFVLAVITFLLGITLDFKSPGKFDPNKSEWDGPSILALIVADTLSMAVLLSPLLVTLMMFLHIVLTTQIGQHYNSCGHIPRYRSPISASKTIQSLLIHNLKLDKLIHEENDVFAPIMFINVQFPPSVFMAVTTVVDRDFPLMGEKMLAMIVSVNHVIQLAFIIIYLLTASRTNSLRLKFVRAIQQTTMYDYRIDADLRLLQRRINHLIEIVHIRLQPAGFTLGFDDEVGVQRLLMILMSLAELSFYFKFYEE